MIMLLFNPNYSDNSKRNKGSTLTDYWSLALGFYLAILLTLILQVFNMSGSLHDLMDNFMGSFFVVFALPKLLDVSRFSDAFCQYDIIGGKSKFYSIVYPFIEIILGVMFLSHLLNGHMALSIVINLVVIVITLSTMIGTIRSINRKDNLTYACMGNLVKLPLSKVALFESGIMLVMSIAMLLVIGGSQMASVSSLMSGVWLL
jgi:hypothetical protein